jgi:hypothetical protein
MLKLASLFGAFALLCVPAIADAQEPADPEVSEAEAAQQELQNVWGRFAPKGWRVILATTGSLYAAKSTDAALVIEEQDPTKIVSNDGLGNGELNTNPRVLLILAGRGGDYAVTGRFQGFLPSEGDPESVCLADPLMEGPGIEIKKQVVSIGLNYWYSCGSWYVNQDQFKFRSEKGRFRLIGKDSWSFHRASGMGDTTSFNYLTGRKKHVDNVMGIGPGPELVEGDDIPKPVTKWSKVNRGPYYLDAMDRKACAEYDTAPSWCGQ